MTIDDYTRGYLAIVNCSDATTCPVVEEREFHQAVLIIPHPHRIAVFIHFVITLIVAHAIVAADNERTVILITDGRMIGKRHLKIQDW